MTPTPDRVAVPEVLTVAELARTLRISERTARALLSTTLPKVRVSKRRVGVLVTDLREYIESRRVTGR